VESAHWLSVLNREQGDLETATENLLKSKELGEKAPLPDWQYRWYLAQARINETQGDPHGALELLREAEQLNLESYNPDIRPVAALKTRIRFGQGRLTEALNWVRERNLSGRAIGERLFVALDTVKGHYRIIFGKLQVKRRTEAVARARELGLL
jgi:ATP/maltotriose-dependent transcriptional regulator MalT